MPLYTYEILHHKKLITGELTAVSAEEVASILKKRGMTIVSIDEASKNKTVKRFGRGIGTKEKMFFSSYLATMLDAGMSLIPAIDVLIDGSKNKTLTFMLTDVRSSIEQGRSLSDSLTNFPNVFDPSYIAIIKAGETSGHLSEVLTSLTAKFKQDLDLRKRITGALFYPGVIIFTLVIVGIAMIIFVVPKVITVFQKLNVKLPLTTRLLIGLTHILTYNYFLTLLGLVGLVAGFIILIKSSIGARLANFCRSRLPLIKSISRSIDLARLTSTLSILLKSGVSIETAIGIAAESITDPELKKTLAEARIKIKEGITIAQSLSTKSKVVPEIMIRIIDVGEKTGSLERVLATLTTSYNDEISDQLKTIASLIEPLMMLLVGLVVGVFVLSIIGPIYQIVGKVGQ